MLLHFENILWKALFSQNLHGSQNFTSPDGNYEGEITLNKHQKSLPNFTSNCVALPHQPVLLSFPLQKQSIDFISCFSSVSREASKQQALQTPLSSKHCSQHCWTRLCLAPNSPEAMSPKASVLQEADISSQRCNLLDSHLLKPHLKFFYSKREEITRRNGIIWAWTVSSFHESLMPEFSTSFPLQLIEWFF